MQAPVCQVFMLTPHTDGWVGYPMLDASDLGFDFLCSYIYINGLAGLVPNLAGSFCFC